MSQDINEPVFVTTTINVTTKVKIEHKLKDGHSMEEDLESVLSNMDYNFKYDDVEGKIIHTEIMEWK